MLCKSIAGTAAAFLVAAAVALFFVFAPVTAREATSTAAAPALWKIDGPQGDIYLFGSIHILPNGFQWRRPELEAALAQAQQLVFELDLDEAQDPKTMGALVAKYGFLPPDHSLHKMLAPEHRRKLDEVARSFGMNPLVLDRMRPWLAAVTLSSFAIIKQNTKPGEPLNPAAAMEASAGVDVQLWNWAKTAGKERGVLETTDDQLRIFADLPRDQEVELLIATLDEVTKTPETIDAMISAWKAGDTVALDKSFNADMDSFPILRKAVLHDRHEKWLPQIERMMTDGRTHLIVVGTAHLVGKDSVIAMLRAKGVKVDGP
jgi:uncharacterized protein YbaP (TraB family)